MVKKNSPFDSSKFGADKPNVNIDVGETQVILPESEESVGSFQATKTIRKEDEKTGAMKKEVQNIDRFDAVGRKVRNDDIVAKCWSDSKPIPSDRHGKCCDPYGHHEKERQVFLGYDGMVTELGNVLCNECLDYQGRRMNLAKWIGLGGLLWKPEDY
jgi:hypothetical protein